MVGHHDLVGATTDGESNFLSTAMYQYPPPHPSMSKFSSSRGLEISFFLDCLGLCLGRLRVLYGLSMRLGSSA